MARANITCGRRNPKKQISAWNASTVDGGESSESDFSLTLVQNASAFTQECFAMPAHICYRSVWWHKCETARSQTHSSELAKWFMSSTVGARKARWRSSSPMWHGHVSCTRPSAYPLGLPRRQALLPSHGRLCIRSLLQRHRSGYGFH